MPFYDYECKNCGMMQNKLLKVDDRFIPTQEECDECGGSIKLVIGPTPMSYSMSNGLKATDS